MASDRHNPCLFLLPKSATPSNEHGEELGLECTQIDLITHTKTQITFFLNPFRGVNELFLDGHACVPHGALVLIVGGYSASGSGGIHILNTATRQWTAGPNMLFPRGSFAWGVIGNRLYIAGGIGRSGNIQETEVYDFETGELWAVAALPVSMAVDVFFVFSNKLCVRGWVRERGGRSAEWKSRCLRYCPDRNAWHNDPWMQKVVKRVPRMTRFKFAVTSDEELYRAELKTDNLSWKKPWTVVVHKLDRENFEWKQFFNIIDSEVPNHCECPATEREVRFFACRDKLLALMHHTDPDEGEVTPLVDNITEVSFLCPFKWASAAILYA